MTSLKLKPTPLPCIPDNYDDWKTAEVGYCQAYDFVFAAEQHAAAQLAKEEAEDKTKAKEEARDKIIHARVVGYLLIELFNRQSTVALEPFLRVVKELSSTAREPGEPRQLVFDLGKLYRDHLLRAFRTTTTGYPASAQHLSRPSFDTLEEMTRVVMKADGKDYTTAKNKALARDGHRCMLTGCFNLRSVQNVRELAVACEEEKAMPITVIACHIFNESTMQKVDPMGGAEGSPTENKTANAIAVMSILKSFGFKDLYERLLEKDGVHDLRNMLSLEHHCHDHFDNLRLWFEGTDKPDCYRVCVIDGFFIERYLRSFGHLGTDSLDRLCVTFRSHAKNAPLPDPNLLALHAVCARVAHMSGAAEAFDKLDRDVEDTRVLALDGSSAHLLDYVLTPYVTTLA